MKTALIKSKTTSGMKLIKYSRQHWLDKICVSIFPDGYRVLSLNYYGE